MTTITNSTASSSSAISTNRIRRARNTKSYSSTVTHAGLQSFHSYCTEDLITVSELYLTCSSQNNKRYTQSLTCIAGDRVHVHVYFKIQETNNNNDVAVTLAMGLYGERKRIYRKADLCSLGTLDSLNDHSSSTSSSSSSSSGGSGVSSSSSSYHEYKHTCPSAGNYHLYTYFTMPSLSSDSALRYTPDLYLNFTSSAVNNNNNNNNEKNGGERFLASGATTTTNQNAKSNSKSCFATGTRYQYYASKARRIKGAWVLGGATVVFCSLFAICIFMSWRRKKRVEKERQARQQQQHEDSKYEYMREHHGHVIPWNHHYHRSNQSVNSNTHVPLDQQIQQYRREMTNDDGGSRTTSGGGSVTSGSTNNAPIPAIVPVRYR